MRTLSYLSVRIPFPTRRSSDLGHGEAAQGSRVLDDDAVRRARAVAAHADRPEGEAGRADDRVLDEERRGRRRGERVPDRKSTRLNSSHGYNSYAVFRLKNDRTD